MAYEYFDRDNPPEIPESIAVCPKCEAGLIIDDIDEYDPDTGQVTEAGFHINCSTVPDPDSKGVDEWWNWHFDMPYVDWLPVKKRVYTWFDSRYRLRLEPETLQESETGV